MLKMEFPFWLRCVRTLSLHLPPPWVYHGSMICFPLSSSLPTQDALALPSPPLLLLVEGTSANPGDRPLGHCKAGSKGSTLALRGGLLTGNALTVNGDSHPLKLA